MDAGKPITKQVHKGYPLAGPCIRNEKLELALAIKKQPFWLQYVFPFSALVSLIVVEWSLIAIACFSKAENKANLYHLKDFTLFKRAAFFLKTLLKNAKNMCTKGTPWQVIACAMKNWNEHLQ